MNDETPDPRATHKRKVQVLCDLVTGVAKGFKTGLVLYGPGGVGKSFTVLDRLKQLEAPYRLSNSRMTGKGLFQTLEAAPDAVHVLEDMERLTKEADALGVLRSGLWAQPGHDRVVTWTTATDGPQRFTFRGGIIIISNRPLGNMPELAAMATRIEVHRYEVTDAELTALMLDLAAKGHSAGDKFVLEPADCVKVTEYLLQECRRAGCPLDLRLQQKAIQTYLQHKSDWSVTHWEDLIAASVRETSHRFRHEADETSPEEKKRRKRDLLRRIMREIKDAADQQREYMARAEASRADFFRRKREIESGEFAVEESSPGM